MNYKKIISTIITTALVFSNCTFVRAQGRSEIIPFDNLDGLTKFGDTAATGGKSNAGVTWYDWGTDKSAETVNVGKGKSIKWISTTSAYDDIVTSPGKDFSGTKTSVIGFSARFDDFNAVRHLKLQGYNSATQIKHPNYPGNAVEFSTDGTVKIVGGASSVSIETGVWYDFMLEMNNSDLTARLSVSDGKTSKVTEGQITALLSGGAAQFELWNRIDFYANPVSAQGKTESVAYFDNVYFHCVDYKIQHPKSTVQNFSSFAGITHPTDKDGTLKEGWYLWENDAEKGTVSSETFSDSAYGTALKFKGDGSKSTNLVSTIVSAFQGSSTAVTIDYDFRQIKGGMTTRLSGVNAGGSKVNYHPIIDVHDTGAVYGYATQFCTINKNEWYHMNIKIDFASNKFVATVTSDGAVVGTTETLAVGGASFPMGGIATSSWLSFLLNTAKSTEGFEFNIDNVAVTIPGGGVSYDSFGKLSPSSKALALTYDEAVDSSALSGASFLVNGASGAVIPEAEGNTLKLRFANPLEYNKPYFIEAIDVAGVSGKKYSMFLSHYTPERYAIYDHTVSGTSAKASFGAGFVSADPEMSEAVLIGAVYDKTTGEMIDASFASAALSESHKSIAFDVNISSDGSYEAKSFVWNSLSGMKSLSSPVSESLSGSDAQAEYPASASKALDVAFDDKTLRASICGKNDAYSNKTVTLQVLAPKIKPADLSQVSSGNFTDYIEYIGETTANAAGEFKFAKFLVDGNSGYYSVRVYVDGYGEQLLTNAFLYVSPQMESGLVSAFNNDAVSASEMADDIYDIAAIIEFDDFAALSAQERTSVLDLCERKAQTAEEIKSEVSAAMVVYAINNGSESDVFANIENHKTSLKNRVSIFSLYDELSSDAKNTLCQKLYGAKPYAGTKDFKKMLGDQVVLTSINNASIHSAVTDILEKSESWIGYDLTKYFEVGDKKTVNLEIMKTKYDSVQALISAIEDAVKSAQPIQRPSGSGGGSSPSYGLSGNVNVQIPSQPAQPSDGTVAFSDMSSHSWAIPAVEYLSQKGVVSGDGSGKFNPEKNITREEFVKMIVLSFYSVDDNAGSSFADCDSSHWSYPYISTAYSMGLINGRDNGTFGSKENISRQDMAVILYRVCQNLGISYGSAPQSNYADYNLVADYAKDAVNNLSAQGIINGANNMFSPLDNASRAQGAKMIYEAIQKKGV